jgi:hypothetical protein
VFALLASDLPRSIVRDEEAFTAEGRAGFENSAIYTDMLREEYGKWLAVERCTPASVPYDVWHRDHHKKYQRMLFEKDGRWQTAEEILGVPAYAPDEEIHPLTTYRFTIVQRDQGKAFDFFSIIERAAHGANGGQLERAEFRFDAERGIGRGEVRTVVDIGYLLSILCSQYSAEQHAVRVGVPDRPREDLEPLVGFA